MSKPVKKLEIKKKRDILQHMLDRPDTYVGSMELEDHTEWIYENNQMVYKKIQYIPALIQLFHEIRTNAIDNVWRSSEFDIKCNKISFTCDQKTGRCTLWNDGLTIPVELSKEEGCANIYKPELVFGVFWTSSNYDDTEDRKTSGRNGYGSKCTNAFSTLFEIETYDPDQKLLYTQRWTNNMSVMEKPVITSCVKDHGYTQVSWIPDFKRFKIEGYTDDFMNLMIRFMYDTAMITNVPVEINGESVNFKNISEYAMKFRAEATEETMCFKTKDSEVVIVPSDRHYTIAFTNGAYNKMGGVHVDAWCKAIFGAIADKFNPKPRKPKKKEPEKKTTQKKLKEQEEKKQANKLKITHLDVKKLFAVYINCSLNNPKFDTQSKTKMTSPVPDTEVDQKKINKIAKWSVAQSIQDLIDLKNLKALKKIDAKKKFVKIPGLDNANLAGTSKSGECTLIICEGLSAKGFVVSGIEVGIGDKQGRDYFGILPITGKVLNVRKASQRQITSSKVVQNIIQGIGLKLDVDYTDEENFKTLRYGKVMVIADSDVDGIHIEGLLINIFHKLFPSLMKRQEPFFISMRTPLVRVTMKDKSVEKFYTNEAFMKFHEENKDNISKVKYFKGLGTSKEEDIEDSFGERIIEYEEDEKTMETMNKVFSKSVKKNTDKRKEWIGGYDPSNVLEIGDEKANVIRMGYTDFIDNEMILFSIDDCARSIPWIDGFKVSQRKILHTCFLKKLRGEKELKVAQLAGAVGENTEYHHGEGCLYDTIVGLAQDYTGSNNIPLLEPIGNFGSRNSLGKDSAQARYIYTRLHKIAKCIIRDEDAMSLDYICEDGKYVEPKFYVPVIPMVLVNGACGIGTGWSTDIPCYDPIDVINAVRAWINGDGEAFIQNDNIILSSLPELSPWYSGFKGSIELDSGNNKRYVISGLIADEKGKKTVVELPIGMATDKFRETLDTLKEKKEISNYKDYSNKFKVKFCITEKKDGFSCSVKNLKLMTYVSTNNMVLFTHEGKIRKYDSVEEIIDEYCKLRLKYYVIRKNRVLSEYQVELTDLNNKYRFVNEVMDEKIVVFRRKKQDVAVDLETGKYDKKDRTYNYLLRMSIESFTVETLEKLRKEVEKCQLKIETLAKTRPEDIWLLELDELEAEYKKYYKKRMADQAKNVKAKKPKHMKK